MGFYYNPGTPPEDEEKQASMRETVQIIWAVFKAIAVPLGFIFGGLGYLLLVFFLFSVATWAGLAAIGVAVGALVALGVWEKLHPPDIEELHKYQR